MKKDKYKVIKTIIMPFIFILGILLTIWVGGNDECISSSPFYEFTSFSEKCFILEKNATIGEVQEKLHRDQTLYPTYEVNTLVINDILIFTIKDSESYKRYEFKNNTNIIKRVD